MTFTLGGLRVALPVPAEADQLLDCTGRHTMERVQQRREFSAGVHSGEVRTGRTGLDSVHVLAAGRQGFGFRSGEVWGVHLAWSGNQIVCAERLYEDVRSVLEALLTEDDLPYLTSDHDRSLNDAGHTPYGEAGVHDHTPAVHRLMDDLKAGHPGLEIEACAAGGGRVDLGVLEHTDRVWASDCIDPLERQQIQRYTAPPLPPELMGTQSAHPRRTPRCGTRRCRSGRRPRSGAAWASSGTSPSSTRPSSTSSLVGLRCTRSSARCSTTARW